MDLPPRTGWRFVREGTRELAETFKRRYKGGGGEKTIENEWKRMTLFFIILGVLLAFVVLAYNRLVRLRAQVKEAWADIEVQLKRRYDLIPNLVETVKGYAAHEEETLNRVIEARAKAMAAQTISEHREAENMLTGALKSLFALAEAYPQLRAVESFTKLQEELTDTEDKIQAARRFYNGNVRDYNIAIQQFPTNLLASAFGFTPEPFFDLEGEEEAAATKPVSVKF
jgi:LemA protein